MFGKKVKDSEVTKDVITQHGGNSLNYYILYDRLAGAPIRAPFMSTNDKTALRGVANLLESNEFPFKPTEIALYHIFDMEEDTLTVIGNKYFVCYLDEVADKLKTIMEEL